DACFDAFAPRRTLISALIQAYDVFYLFVYSVISFGIVQIEHNEVFAVLSKRAKRRQKHNNKNRSSSHKETSCWFDWTDGNCPDNIPPESSIQTVTSSGRRFVGHHRRYYSSDHVLVYSPLVSPEQSMKKIWVGVVLILIVLAIWGCAHKTNTTA